MIYLCGDTHIPIDIAKLNTTNFPEQKDMTRNDYVIVLGDFGLLWHKNKEYEHWLKWFEEKNFTILWLDGNHENHHWISTLPEKEWHGGHVHVIADNIMHLMRGQVFEIEDYTFFVCGGAASYDKEYRSQYIDWWAEELLSYDEIDTAWHNLERYNHCVDYVLTHTCPKFIISQMLNIHDDFYDPTTRFFDMLCSQIKFKDWFFGHWHQDKSFLQFHCLYHQLLKLT